MSWKAGDKAILADVGSKPFCNGGGNAQSWEGAECTLIEYLGDSKYPDGIMKDAWVVQADRILWAAELCLRKPYDGHEPCSWEDMLDIFQPKVLELVER